MRTPVWDNHIINEIFVIFKLKCEEKGFENKMSEKHPDKDGAIDSPGPKFVYPDKDYEKSRDKSVQGLQTEHSNHSIHQGYQKLLDQKIDDFLKKMSDMKDEHPYEDYKKFETSTKIPSYFKELVSVFEP